MYTSFWRGLEKFSAPSGQIFIFHKNVQFADHKWKNCWTKIHRTFGLGVEKSEKFFIAKNFFQQKSINCQQEKNAKKNATKATKKCVSLSPCLIAPPLPEGNIPSGLKEIPAPFHSPELPKYFFPEKPHQCTKITWATSHFARKKANFSELEWRDGTIISK